jgi:hypothetical protein
MPHQAEGHRRADQVVIAGGHSGDPSGIEVAIRVNPVSLVKKIGEILGALLHQAEAVADPCGG